MPTSMAEVTLSVGQEVALLGSGQLRSRKGEGHPPVRCRDFGVESEARAGRGSKLRAHANT